MEELVSYQEKGARTLYKAGFYTSLIFLVYLVLTILIFALVGEGYPETAGECFAMLAENRFTGLLRLDILSVVILPFYYLLFYPMYHSLKTGNEIAARIALFCILAGVTLFISGLNIMEILTLNRKYHLASSEEMKQQLLSAGEAMLAGDMWISTSAKIRSLMIELGAVILSLLMLRSPHYRRATALVGLTAHGFDLISEAFSIFFPAVKDVFTMTAGPLYLVWFILIALDLFRLSRRKTVPDPVR